MINVNQPIANNIRQYPTFKQDMGKLPEIKVGDIKSADFTVKKESNKDKNKLAFVSSLLSVGAILLTLSKIAKGKAKASGKKVDMFNMQLNEGNIFSLGCATVAGAAAGGIIVDDKKHIKSKIREMSHQIIGNIASPLAAIWVLNKGMDKLNIKMPKIKGKSTPVKIANFGLEILPNFISSCTGLYLGINAGNKLSNKINDNIFGKRKNVREVKVEDYCIHIDDPLTCLTLADKSGKIKGFTGKIMPFTFILSGYQVGTARD